MVRYLAVLTTGLLGVATIANAEEPAKPTPVLPVPDDAEAWRLLPPVKSGKEQPLPAWARMLAAPMPRTAAAMLTLERIHRTRSPLDPLLRARLRWAIANANRCAATKAFADADLERLGAPAAELALLRKGDRVAAWERLSAADRHAVTFVRQLSRRGADLTDEQFQQLLAGHGEGNAAAIVLMTAAGNFQDKLFHALGIPAETDAARLLPPIVLFDGGVPRKDWPLGAARNLPLAPGPAEDWNPKDAFGGSWGADPLEALRQRMEVQKARQGRIRVPTPDEYFAAQKTFTPAATTPSRPTLAQPKAAPARTPQAPAVIWSRVCSGYQPELAAAWGGATGSFREDAKQDRVFEESLFWVVTRASDCFY